MDLGMTVELLQHFQLRGGSRVVTQPLVRSPLTYPHSLALEEDYLMAACPPTLSMRILPPKRVTPPS